MATPREGPYVWVTWISKLLAGDVHCEWASWFRAHHTYEKVPSDFDVAAWTARHAELVRRRAGTLRDEGYEVTIEGQNQFRFTGRTGIVLSGKPDLIAVRGDEAKVIDCKTGSPKASDQFQVLVYMIVLPHALPRYRGVTLDGEVQYSRDVVAIPAGKVTGELKDLFRKVMQRVGGRAEPHRVPSWAECRFCDITAADCPDRVESPPDDAQTTHDLF